MRKHLKIVENNKASKGLRFANYFVDLFTFYILFTCAFLMLLTISPAFNSWISNINSITDRLLSIVCYVVYIFIIESVTGGRSLGKLITGTKVIMIDGSKPSVSNFFIRNITRGIILIDQLSFFGETGLHDSWSDTRVISIKNYEAEKQVRTDIEDLGKKEIA
ncbi:RDD family protein [Chryseobacterium chendengshani]|uniref:RDD family protein n=1 Tax=unclassified Chryseobacterium TaxID=2593645 RepID=UPI001C63E332|nr:MULTISPECIES: RDD family protein [unclassified Chryseobacterium]MBW7675953.1 RDD family protein [Chryseobacterium sp. LJ756]MBW8524441.1 RDD family protein [Chryseobacterium sp. LJ668]QYK15314.1 RDD family protein [Chryseobacterium sp. LJ668]